MTRLSLFAAMILATGLSAVATQPPAEEEEAAPKPPAKTVIVEEEDPAGGVKKKIVVGDPPPSPARNPTPPGGNTPDQQLDELTRAAAADGPPAVKALYGRYAVPFDRITLDNGLSLRVTPIPLFRRDQLPAGFWIIELDAANRVRPQQFVSTKDVKKIEHFEELVLAEVGKLLDPKPAPAAGKDEIPTDQRFAAAGTLLAAALRFHDYARENDKRLGKSWDRVRDTLADQLRGVRVRQLRRAAATADWAAARAVGSKLLAAHPDDAEIAKEVAAASLAEAGVLMRSRDYADMVKAREVLDEFETRFPAGGGDAARTIRRDLAGEAGRLFDRARASKAAGNLVDARNDVARAEALDPTVPGLRALKRELGSAYPVLYVGVRRFPERMSPATARFDSEHQAVQLLFEGLLEPIPGGRRGTRYRPGAALAPPTIFPGGRELLVRQTPRGRDGADGFDTFDVVETVKLLQARPDVWPSADLPWFNDLPVPTGNGAVRFTFRHGHPDPRSLLTFKLLPARWLAERGKAMDDPEFAAKPFGTGPYRIHSLPPRGVAGPRELAFVDTPGYGRWKDRVGLPHIREIRLTEVPRLADPLDEFRKGRLHILPDLTPDEMKQVLSQGGAAISGRGRVATAATNRRVHILAVNHTRDYLQNVDVRKGVSLAIDREGIVNDVFPIPWAEYRRLTGAMSGPFPPGCWATVKDAAGRPVPLQNREQALVHLRRYLVSPGAKDELELAYPADDPRAAAACGRIKADVESLLKGDPGGRTLTITPKPYPPDDLYRLVHEEHRYDLAYTPFDYPDDWFPFGLAAFLDPAAATRGGRNVTAYLSPGTNPGPEDRALAAELIGLREHRDFAGDLVPRAARIHALFNDRVPFVPLWQLDRHTLIDTRLKLFVDGSTEPANPQVLDPTVLFHNVARWRLE